MRSVKTPLGKSSSSDSSASMGVNGPGEALASLLSFGKYDDESVDSVIRVLTDRVPLLVDGGRVKAKWPEDGESIAPSVFVNGAMSRSRNW